MNETIAVMRLHFPDAVTPEEVHEAIQEWLDRAFPAGSQVEADYVFGSYEFQGDSTHASRQEERRIMLLQEFCEPLLKTLSKKDTAE